MKNVLHLIISVYLCFALTAQAKKSHTSQNAGHDCRKNSKHHYQRQKCGHDQHQKCGHGCHPGNGGTAPDLVYTPNENYNGSDSFTYEVSDGTLVSVEAVVSITVNNVNDEPIADSQNLTMQEDGELSIALTGSDIDGDDLDYSITTAPDHGSLSGTLPDVIYVPEANYNGSDAFEFTVSDGTIESAAAAVTIGIEPVNDAPTATAVEAVVDEDGSVVITLSGSDLENDPLTFNVVDQPQNGTLSGTVPELTYTPQNDFNGMDIFSFTVTDGEYTSEAVAQTITVTAVNDAPVVNAGDDLSGLDNQPVAIDAAVSDDGDTETLDIAWSKLTGPGTAIFSDPASAQTTATFSEPGSYILMLSASDTEFLAADTVSVLVESSVPNVAPVVNAGADQVVGHVDTVVLEGSVSDDGLPVDSSIAVAWTQVSGPAVVSISDASSASATAIFPTNGVYELQLATSDGELTAVDSVVITIYTDNMPPVVDAGEDVAVVDSVVTLAGMVTDDGYPQPADLDAEWTQVDGPGTAIFADSKNLHTEVSFTQAGTYTLRLTADDTEISVYDELTVQVVGNQPPIVDAGTDKTAGVQIVSTQPVPDPVIPEVSEMWLNNIGIPGISGVPSGASDTMVDWHSLASDGQGVYGAGIFNYINDVEVNGLGKWDGCEWYPVVDDNVGFIRRDSVVHAIDCAMDNLFVGGAFLKDLGGDGNGDVTARWDGEEWCEWNFKLLSSSLTIYDIASLDDAVYVAGYFKYQPTNYTAGVTPIPDVPISYAVARWTTNGWEALGDGLNYYDGYSAYIHAVEPVMERTDAVVYAGGYKMDSTSGDGTYANLARWDGTSWTTIGPEAKDGRSGRIWDILPIGDKSLYVCGQFRTVGSQNIANIAHVEYDEVTGTWVWTPLGDGLNQEVSAMTMHKGKLYAGGKFDYSGTKKIVRVAMWDGATWSAVDEDNGDVTGWVRSLLSTGDDLYIGGDFNSAGGDPAVGIARRGIPPLPEISAPAPVTAHGTPSEITLSPTVSTECCLPLTVTFNVDGGAIEQTTVISNTPLTDEVVEFTHSYDAGSHLVAITAYTMEELPVTYYTRVTVLDPAVITLDGSITDDGLPSGTASVQWTLADGPASVDITDDTAPVTTASFSDPGTYIMQITGSDTELTDIDHMIVTINGIGGGNEAPSVSAGLDQTIPLYLSANLIGQVVDDGLPASSVITVEWTQVDGPGTATFEDADSSVTIVSFNAPGVYTLRLTASDTELSGYDEVVITVEDIVNNPPLVDAGADQAASISSPADLSAATVSDDGIPYGILNHYWGKVSGPGYVSFKYRDGAWSASFSTNGTYVLRLTADDGMTTASDEVTVTVYPDVEVPSIVITSPGDSERITAPTDFIGTVASDLLDHYTLEYRRIKSDQGDDEGWIEVSTGTTPVADGSLGEFDPTLLLNGLYEVRVRAVDILGREELSGTVSIIVDGNMKVGHFTVSFKDLSVPLTGIPIEVIRTYDSRDKEVGDFGVGWNLSLSDIRVQKNRPMGVKWKQELTGLTPYGGLPIYEMTPNQDRIVTITFPDGEVYRFKAKFNPATQVGVVIYSGTLEFEAMPGTHGTLEIADPKPMQCSGQLAVYDPFGSSTVSEGIVDLLDLSTMEPVDPEKFRFTTQEGLTFILHEDTGVEKVIDPNGNEVLYTDNGIFHSNGKSVQFQRDAEGRIETIVDPNGNEIDYTYNAEGDLRYFIDRESNYTEFTYVDDHQLEDIIDPRGVRAVRCEYDPDGRLVSQTDAYGNAIEMDHDIPNRRETVTDRLGNITVHEYDDDGNVVKTIDALGGETFYTYDLWGNELSKTDPMTNTTYWTYDDVDNKTSETDPLGNTTYFTFDEFRNQTSTIDPLGNGTTNIYGEGNRLESATDANGAQTRYGYDSHGQLTSLIDAHTNVNLVLSYNYAGNMSSLMDINGVVRDFAYDEVGNQISTTNEWVNPEDPSDVRTVVTRSEYNSSGQVTNRVDANGVQTITEYNEIGKPSAIHVITENSVDSSEQTDSTYYTYNAQGSETEVIDPDGAIVRKVYDAENRLVAATDRHASGTSPVGTITEYDKLGRAIRVDRVADIVIDIQGGEGVLQLYGDILSTTYNEYDKAGRRTAMAVVTGISTNLTEYEYDKAGRNTAIIDNYGNRTEFEYDDAGRQVLTRDALLRETSFEYDNIGRKVKTVFHDGTYIENVFDSLGRKVAEIDQAGKVKNFEYDDAGRIVAALLPAVENPATGSFERPRYEYEYTQYGALNVIRDPLLRETSFAHDELGRTLSHTLPMGQSESKEYDSNGRLSVETDFKGQKTEYLYDSQGRVTNKLLYAVGSIEPDEMVVYEYNELGNLRLSASISGSETNHYSLYIYDIENRVTSVETPEGTIVYEYDSLGRKIRTAGPNTETLYSYDDMNRLATVTGITDTGAGLETNTSAYAYTEIGSRAATLLPNNVLTSYQYDNLNRLTQLSHVDGSGKVLGSYNYTLAADGRRIGAQEAHYQSTLDDYRISNISYTYDDLNRLIAEVADDGSGNGFSGDYQYDLVGNRLERTVIAGGEMLTTVYEYNDNDQLIREENTAQIVAVPVNGQQIAAASTGIGLLGVSGMKSASSGVNFRDLPTAFSYWAFWSIPVLLLIAFMFPYTQRSLRLCARRRYGLPVFYRAVSAVLAVVFFIGFQPFELLAQEADLYSQLEAQDWGRHGSVTNYEYDLNGSMTRKVLTDSNQTVDETFEYNLENRLVRHIKSSDVTSSDSVTVGTTTYLYNHDGIKVSKASEIKSVDKATSAETILSTSSENYLIDAYNHTGYAQVLEEVKDTGVVTSYTIGDDVLAQSTNLQSPNYLLYDGHGSTRQLTDALGAVTGEYSYDSYGLMLGQQAGSQQEQATKLLYCGESFDTSLQQYNLRARHYDPGNGRFNRLDPFSGNHHDPQSLHKYAYCHSDPVNCVDPSGEMTLLGWAIVGALLGLLAIHMLNYLYVHLEATMLSDAQFQAAKNSMLLRYPGNKRISGCFDELENMPYTIMSVPNDQWLGSAFTTQGTTMYVYQGAVGNSLDLGHVLFAEFQHQDPGSRMNEDEAQSEFASVITQLPKDKRKRYEKWLHGHH